ncbi:Protein CBG09939 [Caenorhabditis briggsae]|uniref:Uncharacterized protein n=3 Tax=Caenorhabditis briggsae TaxID=6238 RepID=A0AAE9JDA6_CAEBR|nr:Protein CBG09939 [Caenorhabditis briggsae]ULU01772.1 hypothetical protein L3Y34_001814 [Caenorhabditis briggsae]UMM24404.1 hypothetical protein L5515_004656 [Caenorhabditis briggsae]CAP29465.2 Protein CBG09939 [Caenorhabditis briggsae]
MYGSLIARPVRRIGRKRMGHTFSSAAESQKTPASTPQRTTKAPVCVDPRSPSQDIERTPIQFNSSSGTTKVNQLANERSDDSENSSKNEEKPAKQSLRQKMFARMKNNSQDVVSED